MPAVQKIAPGRLYIGGQWVDALAGGTFPTINPATEETLTRAAEGRAEDIDRAAVAARKAFEEGPWAKLSGSDRGRILWKIGDLLEARVAEVAEIETLDSGKTITESSRVDVPMAADCFRYFAGWASKIEGETVPVRAPFFNYTLREPLGVVGQIIPWNFPILLAAWKVAPAPPSSTTRARSAPPARDCSWKTPCTTRFSTSSRRSQRSCSRATRSTPRRDSDLKSAKPRWRAFCLSWTRGRAREPGWSWEASAPPARDTSCGRRSSTGSAMT